MLTPVRLEELAAILREDYGADLSTQDVRAIGERFVRFLEILAARTTAPRASQRRRRASQVPRRPVQ